MTAFASFNAKYKPVSEMEMTANKTVIKVATID